MSPRPRETLSGHTERAIGWLTPTLGAAAALLVGCAHSAAAGIGVAVGAALAWVNFRWLQQALAAMTRLATAQAGMPKPRITRWIYAKFFLRYVLIAVVLYVMIACFAVPAISLLAGLLSLGAAAVVAAVREMFVRLD